jgi:hypothetical protein
MSAPSEKKVAELLVKRLRESAGFRALGAVRFDPRKKNLAKFRTNKK